MASQTSTRSSSEKMSGSENTMQALEEKVMPKLEEAKEKLGDLNETAMHFIQKNPVACLAGALGVGFVIGRLASR